MTAARRARTARLRATRPALPPFPPAGCLDSGRGGFRAAGNRPPSRTFNEKPPHACFRAAEFPTAVRKWRERRVWNNQPAQSVFFAFRKRHGMSDLRITSYKITHIK